MNNLKRVLSLALSTVMLVGMMAVGASAADFSDAKDIKNTEAVNFMVALNIINGKDDGSFDPAATVSRAEMAKMITVALNGGSDPVLGSNNVSYSDTANHWARNYIEYCTNLSIISGRGDGTFDPDKGVTGSEAAKMMLVAMGYQSDWFGFTGADWEINVNIQANEATVTNDENETSISSLYKGLGNKFDPSAPLSRDDAAQIINNGIKGDMMVRGQITVTGNGTEYSYTKKPGTTILNSKFDVKMETGIMTGVSYDKDDEVYTYAVGEDEYEFATDLSGLYMQKVEVVMNNSDDTVLGIAAVESSVLATGTVNDLALDDKVATRLKVGKTNITTTAKDAGTVAIQLFNDYSETAEDMDTLTADGYAGTLKGFFSVSVIDNDGDNKADVVVAYPVTIEEVKTVSRTSISTTRSYKFEDHNIADGLKRGDFVIITAADNTADGKALIEKAEVINGTVRSVKDDKKQVQIGSTWYETAADAVYNKLERARKYDLVVYNGYIHDAEQTSGTSAAKVEDTIYVLAADEPKTGVEFGTQRVKALFTDGSEKIITVVTVNEKDVSGPANGDYEAVDEAGGDIYSFSVNKNGEYELNDIKYNADDADKSDYDALGKLTSYAGDDENVVDGEITIGGDDFRFADDAVLFVKAIEDGKSVVKALTGKTVNGWDDFKAVNATLYANTEDGFLFTALGVLDLDSASIPGVAGDTKYGYLVADAVETIDDEDEECVEFTIWNGEEEITVVSYQKNLVMSKFKRDAIVSYKEEGAGEISKVTAMADNAQFKTDAVKAYTSGRTAIKMYAAATVEKLDKDVVILYVNVADHEGVDGGTIRLADKALNDDGTEKANTYVANVKFLTSDDGKTVKVLVVETDNDFDAEITEAGAPTVHTHNNWNAGTVTTPATCTAKGEKTYTCQEVGCNETKTEEVPVNANAHPDAKVSWTPDADNAGQHKGTCADCKVDTLTGTCDNADDTSVACTKCGYKV